MRTAQFTGVAVVVVAAALAATGCGSTTSTRHASLVGWAIAAHPLGGATIKAVDGRGRVIATSPQPTLETGTWYLPLDNPPDDFTVVASGGTDDGRPFSGELKAVVRGYDHKAPRAIHLNPATTLAAAYLGVHKDASVDDAVEAVARFLRIPQPLDLESDLRATDAFFSGSQFMREATAAGGISTFIARLERELDSSKTHAFPRPPSNQDVPPTAVAAAATPLQFLQGLSAAGSIVGTIVGIIRGGQEVAALDQIESQLSTLEGEFTQLQSDIQQVLALQKQQSYDDAISATTNDLVTQLQIVYPLYQNMVQSASGTDDQINAAITNFENSIYTPNGSDYRDLWRGGSAGGGVDGIYSDLVKQGGQTGALEAWAAITSTAQTRFITAAIQQSAIKAIAYWTNVQSEVLAVAAAYENAINTATPAPTTPVSMGYAQGEAEFGGDNAAAVQSQCAVGGASDSGNLLLNEFNASNGCFVQIWTNNLFFVDQATNLMWQYGGDGNGDTYVNLATIQSGVDQYGFPPGIDDPAWRLPTVSDFATLGSTAAGSWNVSGTYSSPLDMLANYAQIPYFQGLQDNVNDPDLAEPVDYVTTWWTSTPGVCLYYDAQTFCMQEIYDMRNGATAAMCQDDDPAAICVEATDSGHPNFPRPYLGTTHANDQADWLFVRTITPGEGPYGSS